MGVVDEVICGTDLVGEGRLSGIFESKFKPAEITVAELKQSASKDRRAMFNSARSSGDDEIDFAVLETQEEVQNGWAYGPMEFDKLPTHAILSRRFGLKQPGKIRLIDDLSDSLVNAPVETNESPKPHTTDVVAALSLELLRAGHKDVYDLKSAYKQLAINPESKWASFIVIFNPKTRKPEIYQLRAVPFGATRSVFSFLRIAHSMWFLGASELNLMWSNFYDDFIALAPESTVNSTHLTIETLFDLLGWRFARDGSKANEFSKSFCALGIQIDLAKFNQGLVEFTNTTKRVEELVQTIDTFLKTRKMTTKESQRLRGRMQFADSQLFGRVGWLCMRAVTVHGFSAGGPKVNKESMDALGRFRRHRESSKPRQVLKSSSKTWFVFTDASYAPTAVEWKCGLGGIIYDPAGRLGLLSLLQFAWFAVDTSFWVKYLFWFQRNQKRLNLSKYIYFYSH